LISLEPGTMFYVRGIYSKVAPAWRNWVLP
jgi:hypothetical protein